VLYKNESKRIVIQNEGEPHVIYTIHVLEFKFNSTKGSMIWSQTLHKDFQSFWLIVFQTHTKSKKEEVG